MAGGDEKSPDKPGSEEPAKRKRGRATDLNPELQKRFVKKVLGCAFYDDACEITGISYRTFRNWMNWGEAGTSPYADFFHSVRRARAIATVRMERIAKGGDPPGVSNGPAKCAQWFLERTRGDRYSARVNVKVEEGMGLLLDDVEWVCSGKDCGCLEAIFERIASRTRGETPGDDPGETPSPVH